MEVNKKKNKIFVLIPALNEEKSIIKVIDKIPKDICEIIIIDNGSTDKTEEAAKSAGATVLKESKMGYGHALVRGIEYITHRSPDIIVFLDGDYSDFPEEIPLILDPIINRGYDFVIGSRVLGKHEKGALLPQARFGNWLSTKLIKLFWRYEYTDLGPFRAIKYDEYMKMHMKELTYGWTVEMQIKAAKLKLKMIEVPVSYRVRIGQSKVTGTIAGSFKAGIGILRTIFMSLLK